MDKHRKYINELIYKACDGKPADIKILEESGYMHFCMVLDNFLKKLDDTEKAHKKMQKELQSNSKRKK